MTSSTDNLFHDPWKVPKWAIETYETMLNCCMCDQETLKPTKQERGRPSKLFVPLGSWTYHSITDLGTPSEKNWNADKHAQSKFKAAEISGTSFEKKWKEARLTIHKARLSWSWVLPLKKNMAEHAQRQVKADKVLGTPLERI